jgi:hypothetical protein
VKFDRALRKEQAKYVDRSGCGACMVEEDIVACLTLLKVFSFDYGVGGTVQFCKVKTLCGGFV